MAFRPDIASEELQLSQQDVSTSLSEEQIVVDIAGALGMAPAEVTHDLDLLDAGLDSIRLMSLVEKWRSAGSAHVDFPVLASDPVVGTWIEVLLSDLVPAEAETSADDAGQGGVS